MLTESHVFTNWLFCNPDGRLGLSDFNRRLVSQVWISL
jgi:hypothetical protein